MPFTKLLRPGEDAHYGGTVPLKKNPSKLECYQNGELYNNKNFYVADASSMPFLAGKTHSFNMMVQARRIANLVSKMR